MPLTLAKVHCILLLFWNEFAWEAWLQKSESKYKLELQWSNLKQLVGKYYRLTEFQLSVEYNIYIRGLWCKCFPVYFYSTLLNALADVLVL